MEFIAQMLDAITLSVLARTYELTLLIIEHVALDPLFAGAMALAISITLHAVAVLLALKLAAWTLLGLVDVLVIAPAAARWGAGPK
jgi:hypothetical protein